MAQSPESVKPVVAVGGVVLRAGRVVLIRRGQEPLRGRWTIPGGRVEPGELLSEALRREMREETGLQVRVGELLEVVESVLRGADGELQYHCVIHDFLCEAAGGELRAGGDALEIAEVAEADLAHYELTEAATRVIRKALRAAARKSG